MTTLQDRKAVNQGERCKNLHVSRNMNYKPNLKRDLSSLKVAKTEKLIKYIADYNNLFSSSIEDRKLKLCAN